MADYDIATAESLTNSSKTGATHTTKVSLSRTYQASTDYFIFPSAIINCASTVLDVEAQLLDVTNSNTVVHIANMEANDAGDYFAYGGCHIYQEGASPATQQFDLQYRVESAGTTVNIRDARITALEVSANSYWSRYRTAATFTGTGWNPNTPADLVFNPGATRNYTIYAMCTYHGYTNAQTLKLRMKINSTTYEEWNTHTKDTASNYCWMSQPQRLALNSGTNTISLEIERSGTTADIRECTIIAICDDDYLNVYADIDDTADTTSSTSWVDKGASVTFTAENKPHLIIWQAGHNTGATNYQSEFRLYDGTTGYSADSREFDDGTKALEIPYFGIMAPTLAASSHTFKLQAQVENASNTTGIDESSVVVFQATEASTGITGTAAITEAADTSAGAGDVLIEGSTAATEASDTISGAGSVLISGAAAGTEDNDTSAATGAVYTLTEGTAAATEANDSVSASGAVLIQGSCAATEGSDSVAAAGAIAIQGSASPLEANDNVSASGAVLVSGAASPTEANDTCAASGAGLATGSAAITESEDACTASGAVLVSGSASATESADNVTASGTVASAITILGAFAATEANDNVAASGAVLITGSGAINEGDDTATGGQAAESTRTGDGFFIDHRQKKKLTAKAKKAQAEDKAVHDAAQDAADELALMMILELAA